MQEVGREMNVSETAFLVRRDGGFDLRWFTPTVEVDLCGHATLARAHVLWQEHLLNTTDEAHFYTRSGLLTARRDGDLTELNFPLDRLVPTTLPDTVLRALNVRPKFTANGKFDYFLEVEDEAELRAITPAYGLLASAGRRRAIVTARSSTTGFN
jgi:predicted PhzF superfamily epimerase YddE/YHI9